MTTPLLTAVVPGSVPVRPVLPGHDRAAAAELALDMMGRAFEALALLYEIRHPGEYVAQARQLKEYVADNFRAVEQTTADDGLDPAAFRAAVLRVRDLFERVDHEIAEMFPTQARRAA